MEDCYIIVLNYNNAEDTLACLESMIRSGYPADHIILVDNGSQEACVATIRKGMDQRIVLLETGSNLGYAAGNNVGIRYALERGASTVAVVNNDVIVNPDAIPECVSFLQSHPEVGIAGPTIIDYKSQTIYSCGATISRIEHKIANNEHGKTYTPDDSVFYGDYVGGACLVFRADLVEKIGYLPECYFLFWEETEWCHSAKKAGYRIAGIKRAYVDHLGSATVNKVAGLTAYYMERNRMLYSKRTADNGFQLILSFLYNSLKAIGKGIFRNPGYFKYVSYYIDGMRGYDRLHHVSQS